MPWAPEFAALTGAVRALTNPAMAWWPGAAVPTRVLAAGQLHGVVPVLEAATRQPGFAGPAEFAVSARMRQIRNTAYAMTQTAELVRLAAAFQGASLDLLAFKGPVLALETAGGVAGRTSKDLDVLVPPEQAGEACRLLQSLGYRHPAPLTAGVLHVLRSGNQHVTWTNATRGVQVELHTLLTPRALAWDVDYAGIWRRRRQVRVGDQYVTTLGREDNLHFLAVHGGKHLWERLAWLVDFARLTEAGRADWDIVEASARRAGSWRMVLVAAGLAQWLADVALPLGLARGLAADAAARHQIDLVRAGLATRHRRGQDPRWHSYHGGVVALRERRRDRARYLVRSALLLTQADCIHPMLDRIWPVRYLLRPVRLLWRRVRDLLSHRPTAARYSAPVSQGPQIA